jgi:hypothetical protein
MKTNRFVWLFGAFVALLLFIWWAKGLSTPTVAFWNNTSVACLPYGHQSIALHIHPKLTITVDGVSEAIPPNIGVSQSCMSEIHTHESDGTIHIESMRAGRTMTLADFYSVWGQSLERSGYTHVVTINGEVLSDIAGRSLKDGDAVVVAYTKQ